MSETTLTAALRTEFGKGAARRIRRAGRIPAVLYGHGAAPLHLSLPAHDAFLAIKGHANPVLTVTFEGRSELVLVKDVQREPVKAVIEHMDLVLIRRGERVAVDVPVTVLGEPAPGTVAALDIQTLRLIADATQIPEHVEVSVEGLLAGTVVRAGELAFPGGAELDGDPEAVVLSVAVPAAAPAEPEAPAEAHAEPAAAGTDSEES